MQSWSCCPSPPIADHIFKVKRGRLPSEGKTISGKLHQGVKSVCCLSAREADLQYKSIRGRVMDNGASINSPFIRNNTLHLIKRCWRPVDLKYVPCCEASFLWNHRHLKENRRSPSDPGEEDQLPENFFVFIPASPSGSGLCRLQCHRLDPATQFITRLGAPLHWIQRIVFIFLHKLNIMWTKQNVYMLLYNFLRLNWSLKKMNSGQVRFIILSRAGISWWVILSRRPLTLRYFSFPYIC